MDIFYNISLIWFILGLAFFMLEFVLPGLILFFFGIGAWIVALLSLFIDMSLNVQLIVFITGSVATVLVFRNWIKEKLGKNKPHPASRLEDEFIGKTGTAETAIGQGMNGKVDFKGTSWNAESSDDILPGEQVIITGNRSILLIVRSNKTI